MHEVVSETAALLAVGLLNYADDSGRFVLNHRAIECALFPVRKPNRKISACLKELEAADFIGIYVAEIDGRNVVIGVVKSFCRHQVISKPTPSRLPAPPEGEDETPGTFQESSGSVPGTLHDRSEQEGKGREGKGKDSLSPGVLPPGKAPEGIDPKVVIRLRFLALLKKYGCAMQMGTKPLLDEWCNAKGKYPIAWIEHLFDALKERPGLPSELRKTLKGRDGDFQAWKAASGAGAA